MSIKQMKREPKLILSSLLAPIASLLVPAILAIFVILTDTKTSDSIQNDDAPVRAAGLLLFAVLPIMYPVLVVFMSAVGYILNKFQKLTLRNLLLINGLVCIPIAICLGWTSPFGLKDQLIGLIVFFPLTALCLGIGAICWWFIAVGHNKRVYQDAR